MSRSLLAIDPGTEQSGYVTLDESNRITTRGICANNGILARVANWPGDVAIEMIASYGMPVGAEVFETCVFIGRLIQSYRKWDEVITIYRRDVKLHLCGSVRAKDANVRQALIDLFGPQGTKRAPGPTYGVKSHAWAALGVAATARGLRAPPLLAQSALLSRDRDVFTNVGTGSVHSHLEAP